MAFDPDKYLAEKTATEQAPQGFDPDAYLREKGVDAPKESAGLHIAKNLLHYVDLFNHLGQPDWAKHLVGQIRGDNPQTVDPNMLSAMDNRGEGANAVLESPDAGIGERLKNVVKNDVNSSKAVASGLTDMATSPTTYALPLAGKVLEALKVAPALEDAAISTASNSTKIPKASLKVASTPEGRATLNETVAAHPAKVDELVSLANDNRKITGTGSPIETAVRAPEKAAGKVDVRPILQAFDDAKTTANDFGGNAQISNAVNAALEAEKRSFGGRLFGPEGRGTSGGASVVGQAPEDYTATATSGGKSITGQHPGTFNDRGLTGIETDVNGKPILDENILSGENATAVNLKGIKTDVNGKPIPGENITEGSTRSVKTPYNIPSDVNGMVDYSLPTTQLRLEKTFLGKMIPWDSPLAKPVAQALKKVYGAIDEHITEAVKKSQGADIADKYQKDLADWSQKIGDFKELQKRLGKIPSNQLNRADALLKAGIKPGNSDLLERIDEHAGTGFSSHSKNLDLASEFKDQNNPLGGGNPSMYPKGGVWSAAARIGIPSALGTKLAGPVGGVVGGTVGLGLEGLSSPGFATKVGIPAARGIGKAIEASPKVAATITILNRIINDKSQSPERRAAAQAALDKLQGENK